MFMQIAAAIASGWKDFAIGNYFYLTLVNVVILRLVVMPLLHRHDPRKFNFLDYVVFAGLAFAPYLNLLSVFAFLGFSLILATHREERKAEQKPEPQQPKESNPMLQRLIREMMLGEVVIASTPNVMGLYAILPTPRCTRINPFSGLYAIDREELKEVMLDPEVICAKAMLSPASHHGNRADDAEVYTCAGAAQYIQFPVFIGPGHSNLNHYIRRLGGPVPVPAVN